MYRVIKMGNKWYALKIDSVDDDLENIESLLSAGDSVLLVEDLDYLDEFGIDIDNNKEFELIL